MSWKEMPEGSAPVSVNEGKGVPVVVTLKSAADPAVKVVELTLVITGGTGAGFTVSVKFRVASGPEPLWAVIVSG